MATAHINVEVTLKTIPEWLPSEPLFRLTSIDGIVMCDMCFALVPETWTLDHEDWHGKNKKEDK